MYFSKEALPLSITLVTIAVLYALSLPSLVASWKTKKKLNGAIKNKSEFDLLAACARKSKFAAGILLMIALPVFFILIAGVSFASSGDIFFRYFGYLCYSMVPLWILSLIVERPLKKLRIEEDALSLEEKYQRLLIEWAKPGLKITL